MAPNPPEIQSNSPAQLGLSERLASLIVSWLIQRTPRSGRSRLAFLAVLGLLISLPSLLLLYATVAYSPETLEDRIGPFGYLGLFAANFASTATVFIPVPGMLVVGHALILTSAQTFDPLSVGLVAGFGMGLGESSAYMTGVLGSEASRQARASFPKWLEPVLAPVLDLVSKLMERFWAPTIFVLAIIPDPVFEFAGIAAGATRVGFLRFMAVTISGNCIRGLLLAYFGANVLPSL